MGLLSVGIVAVPTLWFMQRVAEEHSLAVAVIAADNIASRLIAPVLTTRAMSGDRSALAAIDAVVGPRLRDGSVKHIKVWDTGGTVLYSDESPLIGRRFPVPDWFADVVSSGRARASLSEPDKVENQLETAEGLEVEVYTAFRAPTGEQLIFESYFPPEAVTREERDLLVQLLPAAFVALVALHFTQLPGAVRLARRVQRGQRERGHLLAHVAASTDMERRRLARGLHDDVIQDLAGVTYLLESVADDVGTAVRPAVRTAEETVRRDVAILRGMLVNLYPVDLAAIGLPAALESLAAPLRGSGVEVETRIDPDLEVDLTLATLVHRVTREALANIRKHAGAGRVSIEVHRAPDGVTLTIIDDGCGFEVGSPAEPGHLGLPLARDAVVQAGGTLDLSSVPGLGSTLTASLPTDWGPPSARRKPRRPQGHP